MKSTILTAIIAAAAAVFLAACGGGSDKPEDDPKPPSVAAAYYEQKAPAGSVSGAGTAERAIVGFKHRNDRPSAARLSISAKVVGVRAVGTLAWPQERAGVRWVIRVNGAEVAQGVVHSTDLAPPTLDGIDGATGHEIDIPTGALVESELIGFVHTAGTAASVAWNAAELVATIK